MFDLSLAPPVERPRRSSSWAPWALAAVVALVAILAPRTAAILAIAASAEPVIEDAQSDGIGEGATVLRDEAGQVVAVMTAVSPFGEEEVWCRLVVGGQLVEVHADRGRPAVCLWVRGMHIDGH